MGQKNVNVTVENDTLQVGDVTMDKGNNTLNFKRSPTNATWKLTDISIWPLNGTETKGQIENPPFSNKTVTDSNVSVDDNNPGGSRVAYNYKLYGEDANGNPLKHDPEIINKKE